MALSNSMLAKGRCTMKKMRSGESNKEARRKCGLKPKKSKR